MRSALVTVCALFAALLAVPAASAAPAPAPAAQAAQAAPARVMITAVRAAPAARHRAAPRYTVRAGDTLSGIAASHCGSAAAYRSLAAASGIRNPDLIYPGRAVVLACHHAVLAAAPRGPPAAGDRDRWDGQHHACGDGDGDGFDMPCRFLPGHAVHHYAASAPAAPAQPAASYSGGSGFQACVIARESGGNPRAVNASSGAGGLYQFLPSTWAALGHSGLPENASVAEQNQAFAQEYAQSGSAAWGPYDGC